MISLSNYKNKQEYKYFCKISEFPSNPQTVLISSNLHFLGKFPQSWQRCGAVSRSNLRARIKILNQSEPPYCYLIGQYFYKSELRVCKVQFVNNNLYFDIEIEYMNSIYVSDMNFKNNPDHIAIYKHWIYVVGQPVP